MIKSKFSVISVCRQSLRGLAFSTLFAGLVMVGFANAATVTVSTSLNPIQAGTDNQGWWSVGGNNMNPVNDNYFTSAIYEHRSFFSFDLSGVSGVVTAARFDVRRYDQTGVVTLGLWDVDTPAASLLNTRNNIADPAIFGDLGSGVSYGVFSVAYGASEDILSFELNAAALDDINANLGIGYFSIGGALQGDGAIFGSSSDEPGNSGGNLNSIQNLVLEVRPSAPVPEPASLALVGLLLTGLAASRRRAR